MADSPGIGSDAGIFLENIEEIEMLSLPSTRLAALLAGELYRLRSRRLYLCVLRLIWLIIGVMNKKDYGADNNRHM